MNQVAKPCPGQIEHLRGRILAHPRLPAERHALAPAAPPRRPVAPGDPVAMRAAWGSWALAGPETVLSVSQARVRTRSLQLMEAL
ncbi:hypothetical protein JMM61_01440 [Rhodovulum sulfidophilum]|uniref:hypothetical protein n=1 Tax=Rhodovulum sulfidophilum TaxID=35806 RepID=UPI0019280CA3|nr:hypothetical protein [Rhodovulum sulfidophilum]MBL3584040.1 hypothetical protein [Rhodovulum sulfidophilum]